MKLNKDIVRKNRYKKLSEYSPDEPVEIITIRKDTIIDSIKELEGEWSNFVYAHISGMEMYISKDDIST